MFFWNIEENGILLTDYEKQDRIFQCKTVRTKKGNEVTEMIKVKVENVQYEEKTALFKVVLKEEKSGTVLPVFVGTFEGNAITMAINKMKTVRPLTHDLMASIVMELKGKISKIVISDLKDNIYYANIHLIANDLEISMDSRPSDAIALALRIDVPIYINAKLKNKMIDEFEEILSNNEPGETIH